VLGHNVRYVNRVFGDSRTDMPYVDRKHKNRTVSQHDVGLANFTRRLNWQ